MGDGIIEESSWTDWYLIAICYHDMGGFGVIDEIDDPLSCDWFMLWLFEGIYVSLEEEEGVGGGIGDGELVEMEVEF